MSDDLIGRGVVEVVGKTDDVTAKIAKVGDDVEKMARRVIKSGKDASDGLSKVGEGADKGTKGLDDSTKKVEANLKKQIAAMAGAKKGTEEYIRARAKLSGADMQALEPIIRQWASVKRGADEAAASTRKMAEGQRFLSGLDRQAASIGKTASQLAALKAEQLGVAKEAAPMIAKMQEAERAATRTGGAFSQLGGYVRAAVAAFSIREIVRYADSWTELQNRLRLVTGSQSELAASTDDVYQIAKRTNQELGSAAQIYQRFAQNAGALGISLKDVAGLTDTVAKAVAISGASAASADAALTQFGQSLASGIFRGQEFNSVMEQTPGLAMAIARGFGVTIGELRKMANEGKLTADQLVTALQNAKDSVDEQFNTRVVTLGQSFVNLRTSVTRYLGELNTSTGVTSTFGRAIEALADNIKLIGTAAGAAAAIFAGRFVGSLVLANGGLIAIGRSAAAAAVSITTLGRVGSIALGVLGGPVGLAVTTGLTAAAFLTMGGDARAASSDIDDLTGSIGKLNAAQIAFRKQQAEERVSSLQAAAADAARELQAIEKDYAELLQMFERGRGVDAEGLKNVNKTLVEQRARLADANQKAEEAMEVLAQLDAAARGAAGGIDALNQAMFSDAGTKYLTQIQGQINSLKDGGDPIKIATRWLSEHADATDADRTAIMSAAQALKALQDAREKSTRSTREGVKALSEAQKAAAAFAKEREKDLASSFASISAIQEQARAMEDQVATYGLGREAIDALTISRLEEQAAILGGFEGSGQAVELIKQETEARKELMSATSRKEALDANKKAAEQAAQEWRRTTDSIGQSLTDALLRGFESGKSFAENFRDTLKNMFKTLILQPLIQPVMTQVAGGIQGMLGMGGPAGSPGGIMGAASSAQSMYSAATGGLTASLANGIGAIGSAIGSSAVSSFALGMSGKGAALASGLAGPVTGGMAAGGAVGAGAMVGAALPYIGIGLAALSLLGGQFKGETRNGGQYGYAFDGTLHDNRAGRTRYGLAEGTHFMQGPSGGRGDDTAVKQAIDSTVGTINSIFRGVGSQVALSGFWGGWETSGKGRGGVMAGGQLSSGAMFGEDGAGSVYSGKRLFEAHSTRSPDAETAMKNFIEDLYQSTIQALQAASSELPQTLQAMIAGVDAESLSSEAAQGLVAQISAMVESVNQFNAAVSQMPFEYLRDLSFDASAGILAFAGGLENLVAGQSAYFDAFYSEEEKLAQLSQNLSGVFSALGATMPDVTAGADAAKAEFRAIVEGLDYTTEAGQRQYAMMMGVAGSFAELATGMEALEGAVVSLSRSQAEIAQERYGLETQLLQLQGDTTALRARELDALDQSNRSIKEHIWALEDQAVASQVAAQAAQEAAEAQQRITQERLGLEGQLLQMLGRTPELRQRELDALDASNRGLQERIWMLESELAVTQQREGLEARLNQALGNTAELRRKELAALDASSRALQEMVWALEDTRAATETAYSAVQRLAREEVARLQEVSRGTDAAYSAMERSGRAEIERLERTRSASDAAYAAIERAASAERDSITKRLESSQEALGSIQSIFDLLKNSVRELRGEAESTAAMQYGQARGVISGAVRTGRLPDEETLSKAIEAATAGLGATQYASAFDRDKAYITLANEIEMLQKYAEPQVSSAERAVKLAESQLESLDRQLERAQDQLDALRGIDTSVLSMGQAMAGLQTAMASEAQAQKEIDGINAQIEWAKAQVDALRGVDTSVLSVTEAAQNLQTAVAAEAQAQQEIAAINAQLEWAKLQYEALSGIGSGVTTLAGAIASLSTALNAQAAAQKAAAAAAAQAAAKKPAYLDAQTDVKAAYLMSGSGMTADEFANMHYATWGAAEGRDGSSLSLSRGQAYMALYPDLAADYKKYSQPTGMTIDEYARLHYENHGKFEGRKFARGGFATPGWALVGEEGPELVNFSQPGRVYTADQTSAMMARLTNPQDNSRALVAAIGRLTEQNARLEKRLESIEQSTGQLADQFDNVSAGGNALMTEAMA